MNRLRLEDSDEEHIVSCDCCGYRAPTEQFPRRKEGQIVGTKRICELCANTMTGTKAETREFESTTIMKTICFVGNAILDQLGAFAAHPLEMENLDHDD